MPIHYPFPNTRWWVVAIVIGLLLRLIPLVEKQYFTGDEIRSYLAATAHEGEYRLLLREFKSPIGVWAPASAWTRLVKPEAGAGFGAVARDLAMWDVHPPLYFWFLHGWMHLIGVTFWAGGLLNLLLEVAILALFIIWSRAILPESQAALWIGALWWLHPLSVRISGLTRPYGLLTLLGLLFALALYRLFYTTSSLHRRIWTSGLLIGAIFLGLLTQYLFLLIIGTGICVLAIKFGSQHWRWLCYLLLLLTIAGLLFLWIYPDFFWAFTFLLEPHLDFWSALPKRLERAALTNLVLYGPLLLCLFLVWGQRLGEPSKRSWPAVRQLHVTTTYSFAIGLLALLPVLGTDLFYLLLISPHHAMGPQYMSFVTPFVAFITWLILTQTRPMQKTVVTFLGLLIVLNLVQLHPALRNFGFFPRLQSTDLTTNGVILFDNHTSVHWFNLALHLPDTQPVYVADQQELLAHPDPWLTRLQAQGGLYLSFVLRNPEKTSATVAGQEQVVALLATKATVTLRSVLSPLQIGDLYIYIVTPRQP